VVRAQLGNETGVTAVDKPDETLLGTIVTDGSNNFTVSAADFKNFRVGQVIDVATKTTGALTLTARTVTALDSATNTVTYSGADGTTTTAMGAYLTGQWELAAPVAGSGNQANGNDPYANLNGGLGPLAGWQGGGVFTTIQYMRERLQAINATTYSNAELDKMTYNDLVYAIRVNDYPGTIK
jgi:hypothetical protein